MNPLNKISQLTESLRRRVLKPAHWRLLLLFNARPPQRPEATAERYSICVTTFLLRYETYFRPLIKKLAYLFPDQDILVIANGHHQTAEQQKYLEKLKACLAAFPQVRLISHLEPRGLSHLWNQAMEHSRHDRVFIFNDDIDISPNLRREIETSGVLGREIVTNKGSWSQFFLHKRLYRQIGPFDEGLREIGGEDDDYLVRMKLRGIEDERIRFRAVWTVRRKKITVNSYGKVMKEQRGGYSTYNTRYMESKWIMSRTPLPGGVFVRGFYWKPKNAAPLWQTRSEGVAQQKP